MKKLFFAAMALLLVQTASAQVYVGGDKLSEQETGRYIEVTMGSAFGQFGAAIVWGDDRKTNDTSITDENGKKIGFKSRITILNLFAKEGWEIVTFHTERTSMGESHVYIMQKAARD